MAETALRKEIHKYIDAMPEYRLAALKPLLSDLADDYREPIIEPATPEECAMIDERMKAFPKDFEPFEPHAE